MPTLPGYGEYEGWKDDFLFGVNQAIYRRLMDSVVAAAKKKGIAVPKEGMTGGMVDEYDFGRMRGDVSSTESDKDRAQRVTDLMGRLGLSGKDIGDAMMERLVKSNEAMQETMKRMEQKMGAVPTPPQIARARPAGAAPRP